MSEISLNANAKLNLYLDITGKREDGYHLLETVMQSIDLCDIVSVKTDGTVGITVECSNPEIPVNENNICCKAARYFFTAVNKPADVHIRIDKRIPQGAGLGGGSADAAATLKGLNIMYGEPLSTAELMTMAAITGADVPFCLSGGLKLCLGIGEELCELQKLPEKRYLIVKPPFSCITREAYDKYDNSPIERKGELGEFIKSGENFPKKLYNVFQTLYGNAQIDAIVEKLSELGAEGASLTGSGSAVFGVFPDEKSAERAAREFPSCFTVTAGAVNN